MIPRFICQTCGSTIEPSEKFCSACGERIDWPGSQRDRVASQEEPAPGRVTASSGDRPCSLCGQLNRSDADSCESCGAALPGDRHARSQQPEKSSSVLHSAVSAPLRFSQSWKLTAILAIVLASVVFFLRSTRDTNPHAAAGLSPNDQKIILEIESLQTKVDANPRDTVATLHLANVLHDRGMFDRAIIMYERYLEMNPSNANARVDLGTSYFELSFADTMRTAQYLETAKREITQALSYSPNHQLALFNLGVIDFHSGNLDEAREYFTKCVAIDPNSESGKRAQQFLNQHSTMNPS